MLSTRLSSMAETSKSSTRISSLDEPSTRGSSKDEPSTRISSLDETPTRVSSKDEICDICLATIGSSELVKPTVCKHYFHRNCIEQWEEKFSSKSQCPSCQQYYSSLELVHSPTLKCFICHVTFTNDSNLVSTECCDALFHKSCFNEIPFDRGFLYCPLCKKNIDNAQQFEIQATEVTNSVAQCEYIDYWKALTEHEKYSPWLRFRLKMNGFVKTVGEHFKHEFAKLRLCNNNTRNNSNNCDNYNINMLQKHLLSRENNALYALYQFITTGNGIIQFPVIDNEGESMLELVFDFPGQWSSRRLYEHVEQLTQLSDQWYVLDFFGIVQLSRDNTESLSLLLSKCNYSKGVIDLEMRY